MRSFLLLLAIAFTSIIGNISPAEAYYLYWYRGQVHANTENGCYGFAEDAASRNGLQNVQRNNLSVWGNSSSGDALAIMTCIGGGSGNATAVVMVSSDNGPEADQLAKALFSVVTTEICFEGC